MQTSLSCFRSACLFLMALFSFGLFSQPNFGPPALIDIGPDMKFANPPALQLKNDTRMDKGAHSAFFLQSVGGISFDKQALPAYGLTVASLTMHYDVHATDGSRLRLTINGKEIQTNIFDWQLVPIAKYADSPYYSCFTLFGNLQDKWLDKEILSRGGRILNYHPAFQNTLLGLRLAYMDMLILYSFTPDLPKFRGSYILGGGEKEPDLGANQNAQYYLARKIRDLEGDKQVAHRAYVISDYRRDITFDFSSDTLKLSPNPYFYCWRFRMDRPDYDIKKVSKTNADALNAALARLSKTKSETLNRDYMIRELIRLGDEYDGKFSFYESGTFIDMIELPDTTAKIHFLDRYETSSLKAMIVDIRTNMDAQTVEFLEAYSEALSSEDDLFRRINPAVWDATVNTMRYAAFFRYCKARFPDQWAGFLDQVSNVVISPGVETPTVLYETGNMPLSNLLKGK